METIGKPLNPKPWGGHSSFERVVLVQYAGLKARDAVGASMTAALLFGGRARAEHIMLL